jgi:hypothetical protein
MGALIKLLLVVIGIGLAIKFGVMDQINELAREAALQSGVPREQVEAGASAMSSNFSIGAIMTAIGTLPAPWGAIGKLLFILVLVVFTISIVAGLLAGLMRAIRWFRDSLT